MRVIAGERRGFQLKGPAGKFTRPMADRVREENLSFQDGIQAGVFTVPGDGDLDLVAVLEALGRHGFEGWLVVEAEQDPAKAHPLEHALMARKYLRDVLGW